MDEETTQEEAWLESVKPDMVVRCKICSQVIGSIMVAYDDFEISCKECGIVGFYEALTGV